MRPEADGILKGDRRPCQPCVSQTDHGRAVAKGARPAMRILLIEDDTTLGGAVRDQMAGDGRSVDWVTRLDMAGDAIRGAAYDLILPF